MQQQLAEQELVHEEDEYDAVPICGGNYITPVVETSYYIDEMRWTIGGRTYIDNAD